MSSFNKCRTVFDCPPNCPDRRPACQGSCERYLAKKAEHEQLKAKEKKRLDLDTYKKESYFKVRDRQLKVRKSIKGYYGYND